MVLTIVSISSRLFAVLSFSRIPPESCLFTASSRRATTSIYDIGVSKVMTLAFTFITDMDAAADSGMIRLEGLQVEGVLSDEFAVNYLSIHPETFSAK